MWNAPQQATHKTIELIPKIMEGLEKALIVVVSS